MASITILLATLVLCQTIAVFARPQFNPDLRPRTVFPPLNLPAPTTTTASPEYRNCFTNCLSTRQYNPVCGTDGTSYMNRGRLSCAQRCGRNAEFLHVGTCGPSQGVK